MEPIEKTLSGWNGAKEWQFVGPIPQITEHNSPIKILNVPPLRRQVTASLLQGCCLLPISVLFDLGGFLAKFMIPLN